MAEKIRLRVWLVGIVPVAIALALVVVLLTMSARKPDARSLPAAGESSQPPLASSPAVAPDVPAAAIAASSPSPPTSLPPFVAAAVSSLILAGPPPEPIPELDALAPPPGSRDWTVEQKLDYRQKAFAALDAKERDLEEQIAVARRRGDSAAAQEKQATLAYLRARRAQIDEMMRRRDPLREVLTDAG